MDEEWEKIKVALENPKFKWRTIGGVAKETGLGTATVVSNVSSHQDTVIQSYVSSKSGADLYTTRDHYKEKTTFISRVFSSITNKVE